MTELAAGGTWTTRGIEGLEPPVLVIGALVRGEAGAIACCAVWRAGVRGADGVWTTGTVPFLPLSEAALMASVLSPLAPVAVPDEFLPAFEAWRADPKGLSVYTIPFEGTLDGLIARQMAAIVGSRDGRAE